MSWRRLWPFLALAFAACPGPAGIPCGDAGACPINDLCIYNQCTTPGALLQNLSAVVTPAETSLAPQQYLPSDLVAVNGNYVIDVLRPQTIYGSIALANTGCQPIPSMDAGPGKPPIPGSPADAGYPVLLQFSAPSLIPGVSVDYEFTDDGSGALLGVLPTQFVLDRRVSTAGACAPPILGSFVPSPGPYSLAGTFPVPGVSGTAIILGEVAFPGDAGLPIGAAVRILSAGEAISEDGVLTDGGPSLDCASLGDEGDGGPDGDGGTDAGPPPDAGPMDADPSRELWFSLPVKESPGTPLVVEIGPSVAQPNLPTLDFLVTPQIVSVANDKMGAGIPFQCVALVGDAGLVLPIPVVATFPVQPVSFVASDPLGYLPSEVVIEIATTDAGLTGCDAGCSYFTQQYIPGSAVPLLPGSYNVTLDAPPPNGPSTFQLTVNPNGTFKSDGIPYVIPNGDPGIPLSPTPPQHVSGSVFLPGTSRHTVIGGQAEVLSLPDLNPIALAPLDAGTFDLLVPPGQDYLLLLEPSNGTAFPNYFYPQLVVDAGFDLVLPPIRVSQPGQLQGIVRLEGVDGGFPTPLVNAVVDFYFVTSDPYGERVAFPAASAVTDSQGHFSALGPAAPGG